MAHVRGKPPFQQCLPSGRCRGRAGTEATAARLIMRATLAIKTTEAISNVESPHRGREREEGRAASRYVWHFDIDEKLQLRLEGQGEGGFEVFPGRRAPTLKCNFCGYIC